MSDRDRRFYWRECAAIARIEARAAYRAIERAETLLESACKQSKPAHQERNIRYAINELRQVDAQLTIACARVLLLQEDMQQ